MDGRETIGVNPWTKTGERFIYENPWMRVVEHQVLRPDGQPGIYGVMTPKSIATGVVPLHDDGTVTLVGQWRYPLGSYSWEIPEGGGALDRPPLESCQRELREETGLTARHWRPLMTMHLSNCLSDELAHTYLAWGLESGLAAPDDTERLALWRLPFAEVFAMAMDGRITDAMAIASILKCRLLASRGDLPSEVAGHLLG